MKENLFTGFLVLWLALLTFAVLKEKPPTIVTVPAPAPVSSQSGPVVGRYEVVKLEPNVWRFDTTSGDLCLLLASSSEAKRLGEGVVLCPSTPEETERLRRLLNRR